jgi:hypothetical protein
MPRVIEHGRQIMNKPSWPSLDLMWGSNIISGGQGLGCSAEAGIIDWMKHTGNNIPRYSWQQKQVKQNSVTTLN